MAKAHQKQLANAVRVVEISDDTSLIRPAWTPIESALPDTSKKVLASYLNKLGKRRIVIANWVKAKTQKSVSDWDNEESCEEYDEDTQEFYVKEGWYECIENNEEYGMFKIYEGEVTHWTPMPLGPRSEENFNA
jgi:hypothetical protein